MASSIDAAASKLEADCIEYTTTPVECPTCVFLLLSFIKISIYYSQQSAHDTWTEGKENSSPYFQYKMYILKIMLLIICFHLNWCDAAVPANDDTSFATRLFLRSAIFPCQGFLVSFSPTGFVFSSCLFLSAGCVVRLVNNAKRRRRKKAWTKRLDFRLTELEVSAISSGEGMASILTVFL